MLIYSTLWVGKLEILVPEASNTDLKFKKVF